MNFDNGFYALKFGASWCAPCKTLEPLLKKIEDEFPNVGFHSINVDEDPAMAKKYQIRNLPTVILLRDGQEVNRIQGAVLITPLRKAFRDLIADQAA